MKFESQFPGISPTHSYSAIVKQLPLEQSVCLSTDMPGSRRPVDFSGVQWLGLATSTAGDIGLIPDWEAKFPHAYNTAGKNKIHTNFIQFFLIKEKKSWIGLITINP